MIISNKGTPKLQKLSFYKPQAWNAFV